MGIQRSMWTVAFAVSLAWLAACDDKGSESGDSEASSGGESAFDRAEKNVNEGHEDFKEAVEPAATFVDEKSNEAVGEGKKAFNKVTGQDDESEASDAETAEE